VCFIFVCFVFVCYVCYVWNTSTNNKLQGQFIRQCPFEVSDLHVDISGDGLSSGRVGTNESFTVKLMDKPGGVIVPPGGLSLFFLFFSIPLHSFLETFEAKITAPDGSNVPTEIVKHPDGSCEVKYTPTVEGIHDISLFRKGGLI
jgi:hypothetical protein